MKQFFNTIKNEYGTYQMNTINKIATDEQDDFLKYRSTKQLRERSENI